MEKQKFLKKKVIGVIIGIVIMALSGALAYFLGAFKDVKSVADFIKVDLLSIVKVVLMAAFLVALNSLIQLILHAVKGKKNRTNTIITVVQSLLRYAFVLIGVCWGLGILGLNISTIFASVGIIALIVGFGAESLVADMVTGAFILFENQYNVGDIVELNGYRGTVDFIGIRTTGIRDAGGNVKIVNNSDIKNIINRSERGSIAVAQVGISYKHNIEEVEKLLPAILETIRERNPEVFIGTVNYLGVEELGDSSVVLKFMAEVAEKDIFKGRRLLNRELKATFDEAGIEIAFPQMDVHMKQE